MEVDGCGGVDQDQNYNFPGKVGGSLGNTGGVMRTTVNDRTGVGRSSSGGELLLLAEWGVRRRVVLAGKRSRRMAVPAAAGLLDLEEKKGKEEEEEVVVPEGEGEELRHRKKKEKKSGSEEKVGKLKIKKMMKKKTNKKARGPVEIGAQNEEDPKLRWSEQRYKQGEYHILQILKSKGAYYGKPILRADLRTEARKWIGDTGLLDHLLKHMAGKLAPGGKERFRRRHNPEGIMEYWIESGELVEIRKQLGVDDPYWTPPRGWVRGDPVVVMDKGCAVEMRRLREDMESLRREFGKRNRNEEDGGSVVAKKEEELVRKKAKIEEQLQYVSRALDEMQEGVDNLLRAVADKKKKKKKKKSLVASAATTSIVVEAQAPPPAAVTDGINDGNFVWSDDKAAAAAAAPVPFALSYNNNNHSSPPSSSQAAPAPAPAAVLVKPVAKRAAASSSSLSLVFVPDLNEEAPPSLELDAACPPYQTAPRQLLPNSAWTYLPPLGLGLGLGLGSPPPPSRLPSIIRRRMLLLKHHNQTSTTTTTTTTTTAFI